jgi:hypothetical protein
MRGEAGSLALFTRGICLSPLRVTEAQTRYSLIDPQLEKAGWNLSDRTQVKSEIPVDGYDGSGGGGFTDYTLYRANGHVLAVVEAKRTSRDPREGKKQVLEYVTAIEKGQSFRPFAFMANGEDVFFWESDTTAQRHVAGFFSCENLERLLFLKQNKKPLNSQFFQTEAYWSQIRIGMTGSTQGGFNSRKLAEITLPLPPFRKQQKFAALVAKVESLRAKQRESENELDNLFNSLMQRAFRGELVG